MTFDDQKLLQVLKNAPNLPIIKIFYFLAHNQPLEGISGYETTKDQLAFDLNLKMPTIFVALRWLKAELLVQELKQVESIDFMVNPLFVMNNSDPKARLDEWKRRQRLDIQREVRLKQQKLKRKSKINV